MFKALGVNLAAVEITPMHLDETTIAVTEIVRREIERILKECESHLSSKEVLEKYTN